jgi:serine/threonine protein kinase
MIGNKYRILEKINSGEFGQLFKGENIRTKEKVAIKIESVSNQSSMLKRETQIYQYLGGKYRGIPQIKWFGTDGTNNYMVMTLLGKSLSAIKEEQPFNRCSLSQTISIAINIVQILKYLHEKGLIHRDVKPDNFVIGQDQKSDQLYVIDFGFSKKYLKSNGEHIDIFTGKQSIIGTPNYISINIHEGVEPSRRDDLESVGYIMIYLLGLDLSSSIKMKMDIDNNINIPQKIKEYLKYCRNLWFEQDPDYNYLVYLLEN